MYRTARDNTKWLNFAKVAGRPPNAREEVPHAWTRKRNANFHAIVPARKLHIFSDVFLAETTTPTSWLSATVFDL